MSRGAGGGPKSGQGKLVTRLNALRHGVLSESPVVPLVEREEDWLANRERIWSSLDPHGGLEENLAERVAVLFWRLRRIVRFEREVVNAAQRNVPRDYAIAARFGGDNAPKPLTPKVMDELDSMLLSRLLPEEYHLHKIIRGACPERSRRETHLHRLLLPTLHQLALVKGFRQTLPYNSKHGVAELDPPPPTRVPALPSGPALSNRN